MSVGVISLLSAYQICLSVGATIGRPRVFDERPYKTISNFLMRSPLLRQLSLYKCDRLPYCRDIQLSGLYIAGNTFHLGPQSIRVILL